MNRIKLKSPRLPFLPDKKKKQEATDQDRLIERPPKAPPNSPREKPGHTLFGTPRPSPGPKRSSYQRLGERDTSSEELPNTLAFFETRTELDESAVRLITDGASGSEDEPTLPRSETPRSRQHDPRPEKAVRLESGHVTHEPPELQGLALKQAAAAVDPSNPLATFHPIFSWLLSEKCDGDVLRLKHPSKGEAFMSRSRFSAKDSIHFDHDAGRDVPEQEAAYQHFMGLAQCRSVNRPPALNKALKALKRHLQEQALGTSFHTVTERGRHRQVKDSPELRQRVSAVVGALNETARSIHSPGRGADRSSDDS